VFNSSVIGGPQLDSPLTFTFQLHDCKLQYHIPSGVLGTLSQHFQIINYRQEPEEFKKDFESGNYYRCLHGASWNYYKNSLMNRFFPSEEIGYLRYKIGLINFPESVVGSTPLDSLRKYQNEFLEEILNGIDGLNTTIREEFPETSKEELARVLEQQEEIGRAGMSWISVKLATGILDRKVRHYYFVPLNIDHALLLQFEPYNSNNDRDVGRTIDDTNDKAIQMIVNSVKLS
jgi:hypothetical protein